MENTGIEKVISLILKILFVIIISSCFYRVKYPYINVEESEIAEQPFSNCCADYLIFEKNCVEEINEH